MFTGIVEEIGTVENILGDGNTLKLTIQADSIMPGLKLGDSIAINGVCLTVTDIKKTAFTMDVMPETFQATSLQMLDKNITVNLERAMDANGRFGGHFVTGHVDGTGVILKRTTMENAIVISISVPADLGKFLLMKGSIAVDGISLTVFENEPEKVTISLIPHTVKETVLDSKKVGDLVNLEVDMLAKYLYQFVNQQANKTSDMTEDFLRKNGF